MILKNKLNKYKKLSNYKLLNKNKKIKLIKIDKEIIKNCNKQTTIRANLHKKLQLNNLQTKKKKFQILKNHQLKKIHRKKHNQNLKIKNHQKRR